MKKYIIVFISILSLALFSCKGIKEINIIGVDNFSITKINKEKLEGEIKLKIKNDNAFGFFIYPSEFNIVYSGINLGVAKLNKRVHIDKNRENIYTCNLKTKLADLNPFEIINLLNISKLGKIEIKGTLITGKFIFVKKRFEVNYSEKVKLLN